MSSYKSPLNRRGIAPCDKEDILNGLYHQNTASKINSKILRKAAMQMRDTNVSLLTRSCRPRLNCFDELDLNRLCPFNQYILRFQSNGLTKGRFSTLRITPTTWPETYQVMVSKLAYLDSHLINSSFRNKPVEWLLKNKLASVPNCRRCKHPLTLDYQRSQIIRWHCSSTDACKRDSLPIQRASFFHGFEAISLDKLLFSLYFWIICTPQEDLVQLMNLSLSDLQIITRRFQNVCQTVLNKFNFKIEDATPSGVMNIPIDLVSIRFNNDFIVCAKHPKCKKVKLSVFESKSQNSMIDVIANWFNPGAVIRVSEPKFLELSKRGNFTILVTGRHLMMRKNDEFDPSSALGYLLLQMTHAFKDFDSSSYSIESLKLLLAETEWRERFGESPHQTFNNFCAHILECRTSPDWLTHPELPKGLDQVIIDRIKENERIYQSTEQVYTEEYFYASMIPVESRNKSSSSKPDYSEPPRPDVCFQCHECKYLFDNFLFMRHLIEHVELNRGEYDETYLKENDLSECKHCFRVMRTDDVTIHSSLFRTPVQNILWSCRICCVKFGNKQGFLEHMRLRHFEHEMPYSCPFCVFKSSFQRDVFIHFQDCHRTDMVALCPFCLRSFTVLEPESITKEELSDISQIIYNHLSEHYAIANTFRCKSCCLSFLNKQSLTEHEKASHNPMRVETSTKGGNFVPYVVDVSEVEFSVRALPSELFISNKRPNTNIGSDDSDSDIPQYNDRQKSSYINTKLGHTKNGRKRLHQAISPSIDDSDDDNNIRATLAGAPTVVRGLPEIDKFLEGGTARIEEQKVDDTLLTSSKLIEYMSKLASSDGIILSPHGKRVKCCECRHSVTVDHYVQLIKCEKEVCQYETHCPRAAVRHKKRYHNPEHKWPVPSKRLLELKASIMKKKLQNK